MADVLSSYTDRCLSLADMDNLTRALTNRYVDLGYVTTRVYVPPQDASAGVLRIVVVEGRVEDLRMDGIGPHDRRLATAFPGVKGEVLYLRDLEQGLDQMNRLRSNDAKLRLEPGSDTGGTVVHIDNSPSKRLFVETGWDNTGSQSTGERVGSATAEANDILRVNDLWTLSYRRSLADTRSLRSSESVSGLLSIPYGYWTVTASGSWFTYRSVIEGLNQTFTSSGVSRTWKGEIERVVHRDADGKTAVAVALSAKDTLNYIEDLRLETGSRRLTNLETALHHDRRLWGGVFSGVLTHAAGLPALGALSDHGREPDAPEAAFEKWEASLTYLRPLPIEAADLAWRLEATGQWTEDTLFSTERIGIGGLYSVRGVKEDSLSGDIGGYLRAGLTWTLPATGVFRLDQALGRVSLGAAYDWGALRQDGDEPLESGSLQGAAVTLAADGDLVGVEVTVAKAIEVPAHFDESGTVLYAALNLRY